MGDALLEICIGDLLECFLDRPQRTYRGQAFLAVLIVQLKVLFHKRFQQGVGIVLQSFLFQEYLPEPLLLLKDPGLHRAEESVAVNKIHLKGNDAEEQVTV
jgi:hypothetical protein